MYGRPETTSAGGRSCALAVAREGVNEGVQDAVVGSEGHARARAAVASVEDYWRA